MATSATLKATAKKKAVTTDPQFDPLSPNQGLGGHLNALLGNQAVAHTTPTTGMPAPTAVAPPPPAIPGDNNGDGRVDPFFRPDDLASMASFWSQWNTTFAQLDSQLADLRTQTQYDQTQQDTAHTQNQSSIQDDAAARGIFGSSIKDGTVAQEQTDYTRAHQLSQDKLDNQDRYVAGVKNTFETQTKPQTLAAWAAQQAQNAGDAQNAWNEAHPTPDPAAAPTGPAAPAQGFTSTPGAPYNVFPAAGGEWHVWPVDAKGVQRKVFVKK